MTLTIDSLPVVPKDLLEALDKRFPEKCPDPKWTEREIWMRVGERRVILLLKRIFEEQNENVLSNRHVLHKAP